MDKLQQIVNSIFHESINSKNKYKNTSLKFYIYRFIYYK
jgi:hypothetical protein